MVTYGVEEVATLGVEVEAGGKAQEALTLLSGMVDGPHPIQTETHVC